MTGLHNTRRLSALVLGLTLGSSALAAEPIVGSWKTQSGETAAIASCGGNYCITLKTGKHAGKIIGTLSGAGSAYTGEITDPSNDKTYSGSAALTGGSMKLQGCVMKVFCRSQTWTKL
ncbi:hypothetical protein BJF93_13595 [Xaviernesmea oryzae]|uniref:DUF2147 domain-containing protein n=1 Tax=Xaviernesmea oryzae TaxID=464029 RepID=A0A1Q9ARK3_9HYPH|nr:DUF2147 domain-containing protein [Xaviernesmea oryzae]OLP58018.1 hypothetical protein BJF93_13595 [Xaviernesmea oryzae]SEL33128.1 Uncharacterized conserved protein, DUF2147 family [Xaviernesmea oryzae]